MTRKHPTVLYIGSDDRAEVLRHSANMVFHPQEMMEALGIYIFHYPDLVVIEGDHVIAAEVYMHLRSIAVESIVLLTDTPADWDIPVHSTICVLPVDVSDRALQEIILPGHEIA